MVQVVKSSRQLILIFQLWLIRHTLARSSKPLINPEVRKLRLFKKLPEVFQNLIDTYLYFRLDPLTEVSAVSYNTLTMMKSKLQLCKYEKKLKNSTENSLRERYKMKF